MLSFLVKLLSFTNINNSLFIEEQNALNLSYTLGENQFIDHNYTDEFLKDNSIKKVPSLKLHELESFSRLRARLIESEAKD